MTDELKKTYATVMNPDNLPHYRYYGAEIKLRYLIMGTWHEFNLDDVEGAMACSEIMGQHYDKREVVIEPDTRKGGEGE